MINSIYTNCEIFPRRELISNASDAVDKLYFRSLTDKDVQLGKDELGIRVSFDKDARTVTVSDNGIGMTKDELDRNLGTIAHSDSMEFKAENSDSQGDDVDIIGQFGVGFYSAFMVASRCASCRRAYGSDEAWAWERRRRGLHHRGGHARGPRHRHHPHHQGQHRRGQLRHVPQRVRPEELIKRYSNYVHSPNADGCIEDAPAKPEDAGDDYQPEYEDYTEIDTINSMIPIWKRSKSEVTDEEYHEFYKTELPRFHRPGAHVQHPCRALSYDALIFIPGPLRTICTARTSRRASRCTYADQEVRC